MLISFDSATQKMLCGGGGCKKDILNKNWSGGCVFFYLHDLGMTCVLKFDEKHEKNQTITIIGIGSIGLRL